MQTTLDPILKKKKRTKKNKSCSFDTSSTKKGTPLSFPRTTLNDRRNEVYGAKHPARGLRPNIPILWFPYWEKRSPSSTPTIDRTEYRDWAVESRSFLSKHWCHLSGEDAIVSQTGFYTLYLRLTVEPGSPAGWVRNEQRQRWPFISQLCDQWGQDTWWEAVDLANEDSHC